MNTIPRLTANTPFLQGVPNSMVAKEWYRVLFSITQILGGGQPVMNMDELQAELETQRSPFNSALRYTNMSERLDMLEADVRGLFATLRNNLEGRLDDAECMLISRRPLSLNNEQLLLNSGLPVDGEIPPEAIDGIRVAFTLAFVPIAGSVHGFLNGLRLRLTTDFSVAGNTITYTAGAKPALGDNHAFDYRR